MKIDPLYILPNLFTGASIYLGVLAVFYAFLGRFELACWLVLVCLIFDGLDGRVARLTGTSSRFGVEFDSLADIVAFGVAPAMILFLFAGIEFGKFGVMISGLFVVFGAIRLARFNITTGTYDPNMFIGLPIPAAAVFISSWMLFEINLRDFFGESLPQIIELIKPSLLVASLIVALLMVSNIRYPSFKKIDRSRLSIVKVLILLMVSLAVLYLWPVRTITALISIYVLFGPLRAIYLLAHRLLRHKSHNTKNI